jgi:hypothetical protein
LTSSLNCSSVRSCPVELKHRFEVQREDREVEAFPITFGSDLSTVIAVLPFVCEGFERFQQEIRYPALATGGLSKVSVHSQSHSIGGERASRRLLLGVEMGQTGVKKVITNHGSPRVFGHDINDYTIGKDPTTYDVASLRKTANALQDQQHVTDGVIGHPRLAPTAVAPGIRSLFSNPPTLGQPSDNLILQLHPI